MKPIALPLLSAALTLALAALAPDAAAQRKLYRWTDKDGKVHYTDSLPADAVNDKQEELNNQGMSVKTTERARTPEEEAAWEAEQARLAEERKAAEEKAKMDKALTSSYLTEDDLTRAYAERFDLLEQGLESARIGIRSHEKSLADLLEHAANLERNGKPVPAKINDAITEARNQINEQRAMLERSEKESQTLRTEYEALLTRYRELKAVKP